MSNFEKDEAQLPDNVKYSDLVVHVGNIDRSGTENEFAAFLNVIRVNLTALYWAYSKHKRHLGRCYVEFASQADVALFKQFVPIIIFKAQKLKVIAIPVSTPWNLPVGIAR